MLAHFVMLMTLPFLPIPNHNPFLFHCPFLSLSLALVSRKFSLLELCACVLTVNPPLKLLALPLDSLRAWITECIECVFLLLCVCELFAFCCKLRG